MDGELFYGAAGDCDAANYKYYGVKEEAYPYEQTGNIVISDQSGEHEITFPATFTGMGEEDILIRDGAKDVWSIAFSANHFVKTMGPSGMEESDRTSMDLSIMTRNLEYSVMVLEQKDQMGMGQMMWFQDPWQLVVTDDHNGTVNVSVDPEMAEGFEGYILIVPKALCPENPDDFGQSWFRTNSSKFENSDYMIEVTVDAPAATAGGFMLSWTRTMAKGEAVPFTSYEGFGGMKPSEFQSGLPDDNTYVYELPSEINGPLAMLPLGFPSDWKAGVSNGETVTNLFRASGEGFSSDNSNFDIAANIYDSSWQPHMALSYSEAAMKAAPSMSFLIISFYQDMSELEMYKPSAALVLVKM